MCMLFGFTSNKKHKINNLLKEFYKNSNYHKDGWGIASVNESEELEIIKEPTRALDSDKVKSLNVITDNCISHVRYASVGEISLENTHPFIKNINNTTWVFAHNGTLSDDAFSINIKTNEKGSTDSEKAFEYISQVIKNAENETILFKSVEQVGRYLSEFGKANFLLTNGKLLFVFNSRERSLYKYETDDICCICSYPLNDTNLRNWKELQVNKLNVYRNNKKIY